MTSAWTIHKSAAVLVAAAVLTPALVSTSAAAGQVPSRQITGLTITQSAAASGASVSLAAPKRVVPYRPFNVTVTATAPGRLVIDALRSGDKQSTVADQWVPAGTETLSVRTKWSDVRGLSASLNQGTDGQASDELAVATKRSAYPVVGRVKHKELGSSWKPGCPAPAPVLRRININYTSYSGRTKRGEIVVHKRVVTTVKRAFRKAYKKDFRIKSMIPIDRFGGSDNRSMRADNTSGYACGKYESGRWARHAYGDAVDINPRRNPHVFPDRLLPGNAEAFVDRSNKRKGMLGRKNPVTRTFTKAGWTWGGDYRNPDYQHFSLTGG
ncbi:MAG: M15 family metallopeptidase [Actinomycetia bacterium]|nr:M15 family metallopeptidase [Actinomycetes bacterium]